MNEEKNYWWKEAKIYELYVDKFAGDFKGLTSKLDYFTKLGVNTLHILPHYPSPMADQGYDISNYRNVREELGTLDDFKEFVAQSHARGIRIIADFVLNHVSVENPWFIEARASKDNQKRNFFLWSETAKELSTGINAFVDIKPNNWIANEATNDFFYATFYPQQPDLNWDNPEVVTEMLANMDFWADLGVDGFRLDAACFLIKREGTDCKGLPETHQMIKVIRKHLDDKYPRGVILLAEAAQDVESTKEYFGNGDECQMMYHFPLMTQFWQALQFNDPQRVKTMIEQSRNIPDNCQWAVFLRNHDEIELVTLPYPERISLVDYMDPDHMYVFKKGESTSLRVADITRGDINKMRFVFELLYSTPFAPIMYYGDEIGMVNEPVRPYVIDTRLYVRGEFDWQVANHEMEDPGSLFNEVSTYIKRVRAQEVFPEREHPDTSPQAA